MSAVPALSDRDGKIWMDGQMVDWRDAKVHVLAAGRIVASGGPSGAVLATLVLPSEVNFLVNFITITQMSLVDTYTGVILPNVVTAVAILLLKQAFEEVPQDLIDAARVDGASTWKIFWNLGR